MLRERPDFRRAYLANAVSGLGDSFQFVAVMWIAVVTGGTLGVIGAGRARARRGRLALLLAATAFGTIAAGAFLTRRPVSYPVRKSCAVWVLLLPGYALLATGSLAPHSPARSWSAWRPDPASCS